MQKSIDVKCGIYNTEYRLIQHRDGSISVKAPRVVWRRDTGTLQHDTYRVPTDDTADVIAFFEHDTLTLPANNNIGRLSLQDVLDGYRADGVHVTD